MVGWYGDIHIPIKLQPPIWNGPDVGTFQMPPKSSHSTQAIQIGWLIIIVQQLLKGQVLKSLLYN